MPDLKVKEKTLELTESLERERNLNEMKSRFVSMASHEFRTPFATILTSISLIKAYDKPDQEEIKAKHINRICSSVKNLTEILNDFLSLAQLEKGLIQNDIEIFILPDFFKIIVEEIEGMLSKKNQLIKYEHAGIDTIENSPKILKHIVFNLLSNASKYSAEGKEIRLISAIGNNKVSITVMDQGIGIPEQDQKKLFTEFFRAGNVGNIQGTGLGLSIVKKYMELLNGHIDFKSIPGEGTTFILEFPQGKKKITGT
jgi:signal transduction histidine kinase